MRTYIYILYFIYIDKLNNNIVVELYKKLNKLSRGLVLHFL